MKNAEFHTVIIRTLPRSSKNWRFCDPIARRCSNTSGPRHLPSFARCRKQGAWNSMSRNTSPYIVGDQWLEKRKDGASPDIWQIRCYNRQTRSGYYISTACGDLEEAKRALDRHHAEQTIEVGPSDDNLYVAIVLRQYADEHGSKAISASSLCSNMRVFVGFLQQDEIGVDARLSDLYPRVFHRYLEWRMQPHSYEVHWQGKIYSQSSNGVVGETVSKNLDDVRAALNHAVTMGRVKVAPRVPRLKLQYRSPPRDRILEWEELGAIIGYASFDPPLLRWILLMFGTGMRPEAALKLDATLQYRPERNLLDLHPVGAPRTKKRNPVVPVIPELHPWLIRSHLNFVTQNTMSLASMKRRWRTMRRELKFAPDVVSKTIRHTVATRLRSMGASIDDIASLLGHRESNRTTAVYAKYDPEYMGNVPEYLSVIWNTAMEHADLWRAKYYRDMKTNSSCGVLKRESCESVTPLCEEYFARLNLHDYWTEISGINNKNAPNPDD